MHEPIFGNYTINVYLKCWGGGGAPHPTHMHMLIHPDMRGSRKNVFKEEGGGVLGMICMFDVEEGKSLINWIVHVWTPLPIPNPDLHL